MKFPLIESSLVQRTVDNALHRRLVSNQLKQVLYYTPEYQAYLDRLIALGYTQPSNNVKYCQDLLVRDLIAAGLWTRCWYLRILHAGSIQAATVNLKSPALYQTQINGTILFTEGGGCKSNGSSFFRDTFNFDTGIAQNNFAFILYVSESSTSLTNMVLCGGNMGGSIFNLLSPKMEGNTGPGFYHFYTSKITFTNANHKGLYTATSKKGGTGAELYKDGVLLATQVPVVMNPFTSNRAILALENTPAGQGVTNFYTFNCALDAGFDAFDAADELAFRTIWNTYKTNVGLP